jgi:hypothetical protein
VKKSTVKKSRAPKRRAVRLLPGSLGHRDGVPFHLVCGKTPRVQRLTAEGDPLGQPLPLDRFGVLRDAQGFYYYAD